MRGTAPSVFVNCPFDEDYKSCFEALVFTVASSKYRVRCALEENDSGDIRFEKLCRLIASSDRSVHDLSRVELGPAGLPRFNMPFEFGLYQGARRFGGKAHRSKTSLLMIEKPHKLPIYLSDTAGNDPEPHHGRPEEVIRIVRRYLGTQPDGDHLPGTTHILGQFNRFKSSLPKLAARLRIAPHEFDPFRDYRDFVLLLTEFLSQA